MSKFIVDKDKMYTVQASIRPTQRINSIKAREAL